MSGGTCAIDIWSLRDRKCGRLWTRRTEEIKTDQRRIRANMEALDQQSELHQKYVTILVVQEAEISQISDERATMEAERQTLLAERDQVLD